MQYYIDVTPYKMLLNWFSEKKKMLTHGTYHCACVGHSHFFSELLKYPPNLSSCFYFHVYCMYISQSNLCNFRQIMLFFSSYSCHVFHFTHSKRQTIYNDLFFLFYLTNYLSELFSS